MVLLVLVQETGEASRAPPILEEKALGELIEKIVGAVLALACAPSVSRRPAEVRSATNYQAMSKVEMANVLAESRKNRI